jgi:HK97 family phage major capsid protein
MTTLTEARDKVRELSQKALDVVESTTLTPAEQKSSLDKIDPDLKKWTEEVRSLEFVENRRKELFGNKAGHDAGEAAPVNETRSIGEQFVKSKQYEGLCQRGLRGNWSSGDIELKATVAEGTVAAPGNANAFVATPTVLPGLVDLRFAELVIADLFPQSATDSPLIRYLVETAVTNAAATVAEGAIKPESAVAFDKVDETLHKIATFLPVTDEMLEDYSQIQGYINARLSLFVRQAEQAQILAGDGTGNNLLGILNRPGLSAPIVKGAGVSTADDNEMDVIYRMITKIRTTSFLEPDAIVVDPLVWEKITLSKNAMGAYYANGPFMAQTPATLWGKRVVMTPAMPDTTALVGAFQQGAQLFRKGGLTVEASNSHADYFQRNLTAIRAEERVGLAVYRPGAFGTVTGL